MPAFVTLEIAKEITFVFVLLLLVCNGMGWVQACAQKGNKKIFTKSYKVIVGMDPKGESCSTAPLPERQQFI